MKTTPRTGLSFSLEYPAERGRIQVGLPGTVKEAGSVAIECCRVDFQRQRIRVFRYRMAFTARTPVSGLILRTTWRPGSGVAKCFFTYNDIAVEFPAPHGRRESVTLVGDRREGDRKLHRLFPLWREIPLDVSETYADIQSHGRVTLAYDPIRNRVTGLLDRAEMERQYYHLASGPRLECLHTSASLAAGSICFADMELIVYVPESRKFWWQDGLEYAHASGLRQLVYRLTVTPRSMRAGQPGVLSVLGAKGKPLSLTIGRLGQSTPMIKDRTVIPGQSVQDEVFATRGWKSGLYQITLQSGLRKRDTMCVVRPAKPAGAILFVVATNAWRSYAMNGHYHGVMDHCYPWSYSYSATLLEGVSDIESDVAKSYRYPMQRHYYNNMPSGFARTTEGLVVALDEYTREHGVTIDFCAEEDVHFGRVDLSRYRLVILDNHAEYSTDRELNQFQRHIRRGGRLLIIGGDSFGRKIEYIMDNDEIRYQYLFGHTVYGHYPHGAQYSDAARLKRFGLTYIASPAFREKCPLTIVNNRHPITQGYRMGELISETRWEGDRVDAAWDILASVHVAQRQVTFPSVAVHKRYAMVYFGPMGIAETLAGYYGNRAAVKRLFFNILNYQLAFRAK